MKIIYVDGYCIGNPGKCGCRGLMDGVEIFRHELGHGTNNIAEFIAIVLAVKYAEDNNLNAIIYSDSQTALSWVKQGFSNSNTEHPVLQRAEKYLKTVKWTGLISICKWDTKTNGEIPADFGFKNSYKKY